MIIIVANLNIFEIFLSLKEMFFYLSSSETTDHRINECINLVEEKHKIPKRKTALIRTCKILIIMTLRESQKRAL